MNERNWGGKREGSGRKKTGRNIVNITLTLKKGEAEELKKIAKQENLSVSQLIAKFFHLSSLAEATEKNQYKLPENISGKIRLSEGNIKKS